MEVVRDFDQKKLQAKPLKSAVDDWVGRLLALVSSDMPDKCWVDVVLLGVTCQECNSDRFFSLYFVWFNSLLSHIKHNLESSRMVRAASCTSISDLLTRLSRFTNTKKDAVSHSKVILPSLNYWRKNLQRHYGKALSIC
ncbi:hypothetical protein F2Q70_00023851 [Brassica cretica]|uniref:Pre-rRNA-processing protein RIX1 N-terminal domain-containing protein n=1 Tax=Brassica cretica TaxID=69181 RepID=A0A8S9HP40_BRACR|nr:hypothetical protein F2Q70_00023851 [Brassica cretica]KAF2558667.1 hypothetical protein F2Q68_00018178 [Brassica cretica]